MAIGEYIIGDRFTQAFVECKVFALVYRLDLLVSFSCTVARSQCRCSLVLNVSSVSCDASSKHFDRLEPLGLEQSSGSSTTDPTCAVHVDVLIFLVFTDLKHCIHVLPKCCHIGPDRVFKVSNCTSIAFIETLVSSSPARCYKMTMNAFLLVYLS